MDVTLDLVLLVRLWEIATINLPTHRALSKTSPSTTEAAAAESVEEKWLFALFAWPSSSNRQSATRSPSISKFIAPMYLLATDNRRGVKWRREVIHSSGMHSNCWRIQFAVDYFYSVGWLGCNKLVKCLVLDGIVEYTSEGRIDWERRLLRCRGRA